MPPPAISGGSLAALEDGTWVAADADRATIWHLDSSHVLGQYALSDGEQPGRVLAHGTRAYVVLRRSGQLVEVDLPKRLVTRWDTCIEPRALAVRGQELLVGCASGRIESRALADMSNRQTVLDDSALADLRDLTNQDGRLLASTFRSAQVFELVEGRDPRPLHEPSVGFDSYRRAFVPRIAWRMRGDLLVAQQHLATQVIEPGQYYGPPAGSPLGVVSTVVSRVVGDAVQALAIVPSAVVPVDVAEDAKGVVIVSAGTNSLVRIDKATLNQTDWAVPGQPTSVATSGNTIAVFLREPGSLLLYTLDGQLQSNVSMNAWSVFSTGHDLFHRATPAQIACASCHPEAGDDAHVWSFPEGQFKTPSLRGGLAQTAPFHWAGDLPDMPNLMERIMSERMGGLRQTAERSQALLAWLDKQPALLVPKVDVDAAARGEVLFSSVETGCSGCHSGSQGTNNQTVDVGTGGAFQVPRLTELGWRSPLFHDGRIARLESRFLDAAGGGRHGRVSQLTTEQRADLLAYLRSR